MIMAKVKEPLTFNAIHHISLHSEVGMFDKKTDESIFVT